MTTRPTKHRRSTIVALAAGVLGASLLIAAMPTPRRNTANPTGSPLEYRWVARDQGGAGVSLLPSNTDGDRATATVTEPFLTLADVDSIILFNDNGASTVAAAVRADVRDRLRKTTRQHVGSEVAVVVEGVVVTRAKVQSELGGPLPIWSGSAAEASMIAERLRATQRRTSCMLTGSCGSDPVIVTVTKVGTKNVAVDSRGQLTGEILLYGDGPVKVGFGTGEPWVVSDTIRLKTFPAFTADVTNGDVHIELRGDGDLELIGAVTGGMAATVGATGHHLVLVKGGTGIRTIRRK